MEKKLVMIFGLMMLSACGGSSSSSQPHKNPQPQPNSDQPKKIKQKIIDFKIGKLKVGDTKVMTVHASSGLPVKLATKSPQICSFVDTRVKAIKKGTCVLQATQGGNDTFQPAKTLTLTTLVNPVCTFKQYLDVEHNTCKQKAQQSISGLDFSLVTVAHKVLLEGVATSGLPVSYVSKAPTVCGLEGNKIVGLAKGICKITAKQAGSKTFLPVEQMLVGKVVAQSKLAATGITGCATDTQYKRVECNRSNLGSFFHLNQDGELQAGREMKYSLVSANGSNCVKDLATNLFWEQKTDDNGLRDKDNTYTIYNPDEKTNGGNVGELDGGACLGSKCDTQNYIQALNNSKYCGFEDWRLPSINELQSIVDYESSASRVNNIFKHTQSKGIYWSNVVSGTGQPQTNY